ncbi:MAG: TIGR03564 family F420-dependent LLM class oxidoreductase [Actinobacteria bacterium]|jgi:F420-dependent oxidoreductase-like protein|nr:TIGR03564 family F420-dependent LLM class oxidoreductase [Actinomycetota bacterium]
MEIAIFGFESSIPEFETNLRTASEQGFKSYWTPQIFGMDALTAMAAIGDRVPDIRMGTAVVPTFPRHPMMLAQQALTTQSAISGRLNLGIGLAHKPVVEGMWGLKFEKPVGHLRDYLNILMPLLHSQKVSYSGDNVTGRGEITTPKTEAPPVFVAALGPQMLRLTGQMADGTITWMTGQTTLAELTVPTICDAAEEAGRKKPQVVAGFPVCVTNNKDAARERAAREFSIYGQLPSYRAMLDREGLGGPEDLAIIGSASEVAERIKAIEKTGIDSFTGSEFGNSDEKLATREVLISLLN